VLPQLLTRTSTKNRNSSSSYWSIEQRSPSIPHVTVLLIAVVLLPSRTNRFSANHSLTSESCFSLSYAVNLPSSLTLVLQCISVLTDLYLCWFPVRSYPLNLLLVLSYANIRILSYDYSFSTPFISSATNSSLHSPLSSELKVVYPNALSVTCWNL